MSRLDSFIRRMSAQRDCLDRAATLIADKPGIVLELGLGNGRSYDHLRELLPDRDIYVFDRRIAAHPDCVPDADHLFLGEILEQLPVAAARLGHRAVLIHTDIGTGHPDHDAAVSAALVDPLVALVAPGGVVVSDQGLRHAALEPIGLPPSVLRERYYMYRLG